VPTAVQQQQAAPQTPPAAQSTPSVSDITRSDQSEHGSSNGPLSGAFEDSESYYDPSYTELKAASSRGRTKRQRIDQTLGGMFEFDRSHELEADLKADATYDREEDLMNRNTDFAALQRSTSIENFERIHSHDINLEDCFIERQPAQRGSPFFFGLAMVFGAVGAVTSMQSTSVDTGIDQPSTVSMNTGAKLAASGDSTLADSGPLKDGYEELTSIEVDPSSTSQNVYTALRLLGQAMKTVPVMTYISFALSILFLFLYLNPVSRLMRAMGASEVQPERPQVTHKRKSSSSSSKRRSTNQSRKSSSGSSSKRQ